MKIAIIEDDINYRKSLETAFEDYPQYEIVSFKNPKDALKKLDDSFHLVITDINMPQMDGLSFLQELNGRYEAIVITGNASVQNAIKSIRLGVKDFLVKGFEIEALIEAIERSHRVHTITQSPTKAQDSTHSHKSQNLAKDFISTSPKLEEAKNIALKVAKTDASVLILGQSGVGKDVFANFIHKNSSRANAPFIAINMAAIPEHLLESELFGYEKGQSGVGKDVFANFIHKNSSRANAPFIAINMAAIPEHLLESELFGYEKGAFTDATSPKPGILEDANGGSVFLDEIGEMPLALQAKLLRVLQEKSVTRLGSSKPIKIDVRFISATNANIQAKIAKNEFREDLFFRLQTIPLPVPPLKERKEEILPLSEWKLESVNIQAKIAKNEFREDLFFRLQTIPLPVPPLKERKEEILPLSEWKLESVCMQYGLGQKRFSKEAKDALLSYEWYGNVRELLSVVERAGILSESGEISPKDLCLESRNQAFGGGTSPKQGISELEKQLIAQTLLQSQNDLQPKRFCNLKMIYKKQAICLV